MGLDFCDSKPIEAPLITSLTIDTICLFLQLALLTFSLYHQFVSKNASQGLAKLSLFCQFISFIWIAHSTFMTDLEPLFFEIKGKTSFYCQVGNWGISFLMVMSYYIGLIIFWAWRLQMAFSTTAWGVSKTLVKVSKKRTFRMCARSHTRVYVCDAKSTRVVLLCLVRS